MIWTAGTTIREDIMATTPRKQPDKIERRDFLKKTGTVAGAIAAGFPGIISGQTVTNALKVGLVGCGGRGSGAAAQALTRRPQQRTDGRRRYRRGHRPAGGDPAEGQHAVRGAGEDRPRLLRAGCVREGHQQRRRRGAARDAPGLPAAAPDRGGERQQARLLRKALRDRFARRARGPGGAEAGADEEPGAGRRGSAGATTT